VNLALFDFDGTITFGDTFTPFIRFAGGWARLAASAIVLSPMIAGYKLGLVPSSPMRVAIVRKVLGGRKESEIAELGRRYAATLGKVVRPEVLAKVRWHQGNGDDVVVVSASLSPYLRVWCSELGIGLICAELEAAGGVLTGRYVEGDCCGAEKARRVRARYDLSRYSTVFAYGDTDEDAELLQLANRRFFRGEEVT